MADAYSRVMYDASVKGSQTTQAHIVSADGVRGSVHATVVSPTLWVAFLAVSRAMTTFACYIVYIAIVWNYVVNAVSKSMRTAQSTDTYTTHTITPPHASHTRSMRAVAGSYWVQQWGDLYGSVWRLAFSLSVSFHGVRCATRMASNW